MPNNNDKRQNDEYDTPWKEILEAYFKDFLAFFLPVAHDGIDWQRGHEFLDTELARITREAEIGDRRMDKLVKVWQLDGDERWVLIHVEIQGDRKTNFSEGMYTYQYRAYDLQKRPVVGLAILADEESGWRPSEHGYDLWETQLIYRFKMVKLLDYLERRTELESSNNPFAVVTLAHLQAKKTKNQTEDRYRVKLHLIRSLYQRGFSQQQVVDLFRFIDWVLRLPEEADKRLLEEVYNFEENQKMPYISSAERFGEEKGFQKGIQIGMQLGEKKWLREGEREGKASTLLSQLEYRFGEISHDYREKIANAELSTLEAWSLRLLDAKSIGDVFEHQ